VVAAVVDAVVVTVVDAVVATVVDTVVSTVGPPTVTVIVTSDALVVGVLLVVLLVDSAPLPLLVITGVDSDPLPTKVALDCQLLSNCLAVRERDECT
jgi:hypothetical protein